MKIPLLTVIAVVSAPICNAYVLPSARVPPLTFRPAETTSTTVRMTANDAPNPTTFREAEVLGLRLMQEGNFEEALVGTSNGIVDEQSLMDEQKDSL